MLSLHLWAHLAFDHQLQNVLELNEVAALLTALKHCDELRLAIAIIIQEVIFTEHVVSLPNVVLEVRAAEPADGFFNGRLLRFVRLLLDLNERLLARLRLDFVQLFAHFFYAFVF